MFNIINLKEIIKERQMDYKGILEEFIDADLDMFGERSDIERIVIQVLNVLAFAVCILMNGTSQSFMPMSLS